MEVQPELARVLRGSFFFSETSILKVSQREVQRRRMFVQLALVGLTDAPSEVQATRFESGQRSTNYEEVSEFALTL